jgi:hypothetical protein
VIIIGWLDRLAVVVLNEKQCPTESGACWYRWWRCRN